MPLPALVAIVVIGIALTVLAVHFTGGSTPARLAGKEEAMRRFLVDFPAENVESVHLTVDGRTAFIPLHGSAIGVVHAVGRNFLTRFVTRTDVASLSINGSILALRLRDFTWNGGVFSFVDPVSSSEIADVLKPDHANAENRT